MGREEPLYRDGRWVARPGRMTEVRHVEPGRGGSELQDFLAGTIFAYGAAVLSPDQPDGAAAPDVPPLFVVMVHEDESTFGVCPQLRQLFDRLDRDGMEHLAAELVVGASWTVMAQGENSLVKLKLDFRAPVTGHARIVLLGENYAGMWQYIASGGMVGISTPQRLQRAQATPGATLHDGVQACIPIGIASSPGIQQLIRLRDWPADHLHA